MVVTSALFGWVCVRSLTCCCWRTSPNIDITTYSRCHITKRGQQRPSKFDNCARVERYCINANFILHAYPSKVTFSYIVSITQWGHPDWDAWTWNKFNAIGLRLVIDGLPFKESGTYADPNVKNTEDVIGDITMSLPAGPHIAKLQWKAVGTSVEEWRSLQSILDGFAGSRKLLAVLHQKTTLR